MVEHLWIRIAELRQEAAIEEWEQKHPISTRWLRRLRWLRIRSLLFAIWLSNTQMALSLLGSLEKFRKQVCALMLRCYLVVTRFIGVRPARASVERLRTRELLAELQARGLANNTCVEREDLLDELCGRPEQGKALMAQSSGLPVGIAGDPIGACDTFNDIV